MTPQFNLLEPRSQMRTLREVYISFIIRGKGWGVIYVRRGASRIIMKKVHDIYDREN